MSDIPYSKGVRFSDCPQTFRPLRFLTKFSSSLESSIPFSQVILLFRFGSLLTMKFSDENKNFIFYKRACYDVLEGVTLNAFLAVCPKKP